MVRIAASAGLALSLAMPAATTPAAAAGFGSGADGSSPTVAQHRDFAGKPCLTTGGSARAHVVNPRVFDHVMTLDNHCSQIIKVKICYYRTDECVNAEVPGYTRKETLLGSFPALSQFRYDVKEQF